MTETQKSKNFVEPCTLPPPRVLGHLVLLCKRSALHRRWTVDDLIANFLPPINFGQYQLYGDGEEIVGVITWAWFDEATEAKLLKDWQTPHTEKWQSGERLWFVDFLAPFGHTRAMARHFRAHVMPAPFGHGLRRRPDGSVYRVGTWCWRREERRFEAVWVGDRA